MTENGYIKLFRSLANWEWYTDGNTLRVFLDLLLNANFTDGRFQGYPVQRGSLVTSVNHIACRIGLSIQNVRTSLNKLKSAGEITIKSTNKFSIITIVNWEKFQGWDDDTNKQVNNQLTNNQQTTNNNIRKKESKNVRSNTFVPPTADEVRAYCRERNNSVDADTFVDFYESKGWLVGKNKMRDWKAAVRTWEKNRQSSYKSNKRKTSYPEHEIDEDKFTSTMFLDLENMELERSGNNVPIIKVIN